MILSQTRFPKPLTINSVIITHQPMGFNASYLSPMSMPHPFLKCQCSIPFPNINAPSLSPTSGPYSELHQRSYPQCFFYKTDKFANCNSTNKACPGTQPS